MSSIPAAKEAITDALRKGSPATAAKALDAMFSALADKIDALEEANTVLQQAVLDRLAERKALAEENAKLRAEREEALERLRRFSDPMGGDGLASLTKGGADV